MTLPVDISAVFKEVADIEAAKETPLSVSVFIDGSAPADLVAHVRRAFASERPNVRLTIAYLGDSDKIYPADDMAVIVAGLSEDVGAMAAAVRAAGVPVMVATTLPSLVDEIARAQKTPVPEGDIVSPERARGVATNVGDAAFTVGLAAVYAVSSAAELVGTMVPAANTVAHAIDEGAASAREKRNMQAPIGADQEPYVLDEKRAAAFDARMGQWVVAACRDKRLAYSIAFPFVARALASDAVTTTSLENVGIGLLPFVPHGADMPLMTLNQAKMALQIAAAFGYDMNQDRVKEIVAVVASAFASRQVARTLVDIVPPAKAVVSAGVGYAATQLLGRAMVDYFEGGGDAQGLGRALGGLFELAQHGIDALAGVIGDQMERSGIDASDVKRKVAGAVSKVAGFAASHA